MALPNKRVHQKSPKSRVNVRGFFRVNIVEQDGRISGDSGWFENTVVDLGKRDYLCAPLMGGAAKSISRMALGTGTAVNATHTSLNGELSHQTNAASGTRNRFAASTSQVGSTGAQFYCTFASSISFCTTAVSINNIMVINDVTTAGTIFAGNTFVNGSSVLNTNQDVQATYLIQFT